MLWTKKDGGLWDCVMTCGLDPESWVAPPRSLSGTHGCSPDEIAPLGNGQQKLEYEVVTCPASSTSIKSTVPMKLGVKPGALGVCHPLGTDGKMRSKGKKRLLKVTQKVAKWAPDPKPLRPPMLCCLLPLHTTSLLLRMTVKHIYLGSLVSTKRQEGFYQLTNHRMLVRMLTRLCRRARAPPGSV